MDKNYLKYSLLIFAALAIFVHQNCSSPNQGQVAASSNKTSTTDDQQNDSKDIKIPEDPASSGNGQAYTGKGLRYVYWDTTGSCPGENHSEINVLSSQFFLVRENCRDIDSRPLLESNVKVSDDLTSLFYDNKTFLDVDSGRHLGQLCGISAVQGDRRSLSLSKDVKCFGHDPKTSCPKGFSSTWYSMRAWGDDAISDTIYSCVRTDKSLGPSGHNSQWCGAGFVGEGVNGPQIKCQGVIPSRLSCPAKMIPLELSFIRHSAQASAASLWTCLQDDEFLKENIAPQGEWCGLKAENNGSRPSAKNGMDLKCRRNTVDNCPPGFSKLSFIIMAWGDDTEGDLVSTCLRN